MLILIEISQSFQITSTCNFVHLVSSALFVRGRFLRMKEQWIGLKTLKALGIHSAPTTKETL